MFIETKEIDPDGLAVDRDQAWSLPPPRPGDEPVSVEHVRLSGEVREEEDGYAFSGDIDTVATLASDDRHAAVVVTFCNVPSERVAVALS